LKQAGWVWANVDLNTVATMVERPVFFRLDARRGVTRRDILRVLRLAFTI